MSSPSSNSKKRGAVRPDLRGTLAEALGGVGSASPAADRRAPEGIRGSSENWSPPRCARASCPGKHVPHDSSDVLAHDRPWVALRRICTLYSRCNCAYLAAGDVKPI